MHFQAMFYVTFLSSIRYGRPDPQMERQFDVQVKLRMASVRYLHTMRFLKEILAFISHFPQLIDAFQRMKAMAQGNMVGIWMGGLVGRWVGGLVGRWVDRGGSSRVVLYDLYSLLLLLFWARIYDFMS